MTEALQAEQCQVPDVLALPMCSRCSPAAESPHARCGLDDLPEPARGLIKAACHGSERALLIPLPHTQCLARLQKARRPIPQVHARSMCAFRGAPATMPARQYGAAMMCYVYYLAVC